MPNPQNPKQLLAGMTPVGHWPWIVPPGTRNVEFERRDKYVPRPYR